MNFQKFGLAFFAVCFLSINMIAQKPALDHAMELYEKELIDSALLYFEEAYGANPSNAKLQLKLAELYRYTNQPAKSAFMYETLVKSPNISAIPYFWYAYVLKMNGQYEKSRDVLRKLKSHPEVVGNSNMVQLIEYNIHSCDFAIEHKGKTPAFKVVNEKAANSAAADFNPVFYKNQLYFSSKRIIANIGGQSGQYSPPNADFVYTASRNNLRTLGNVQLLHDPNNLGFLIDHYNLAPLTISKNGDLIFSSFNSFPSGVRHPFRPAKPTEGVFEMGYYKVDKPVEMGGASNQFPYNYKLAGFPCLTDNGKTLYFSAQKLPINNGGFDIYVSYYENGNWSTPQNLGPNINGPGHEISPYVDEEGVLYFSSDGHKGFGGFDVYRAEQDNGSWKEVRNLGYGVNSAQDDLYFIFDALNDVAYFSSNRNGGMGDYDIYSAYFMGDLVQLPKITDQEEDYVITNPTPDPVDPTPNTNNNNTSLVDNTNDINPDPVKPNNGGGQPLITPNNNNVVNNNNPPDKKPNTDNRIPCADNAYIGVIVDGITQQRVPEAWVYIKNLTTNVERKTKTSKYGEYAVILEPNTQYEIRASRQGYENILFEVYTADGKKRTLLGEHEMKRSATATVDDILAMNGMSGRSIDASQEEFVRNAATDKRLPSEGYLVQFGVFRNISPDLQQQLLKWGNIVTAPYKGGEAKIYRLGIYAEKEHAQEILAKVKALKGLDKSFLKTTEVESRTSADKMNNQVLVVYPKHTKVTATKELVGVDDPEKNIVEVPKGMQGRGINPQPAEPVNEVVVKENPRTNYADNPSLGGTSRGASAARPLEFKVQIGAYKDAEKADFPDVSRIGTLEKRLNAVNGLTYFFISGFTTLDDARKARVKAEQTGIKSPFIVPFKNGKKVSMSEAVND